MIAQTDYRTNASKIPSTVYLHAVKRNVVRPMMPLNIMIMIMIMTITIILIVTVIVTYLCLSSNVNKVLTLEKNRPNDRTLKSIKYPPFPSLSLTLCFILFLFVCLSFSLTHI